MLQKQQLFVFLLSLSLSMTRSIFCALPVGTLFTLHFDGQCFLKTGNNYLKAWGHKIWVKIVYTPF